MKTLYLILLYVSMCYLKVSAQQTMNSVTALNGEKIGFLLSLPRVKSNEKLPLIIFLHGIDERGNGSTELNKVSANGLPRLLQTRYLSISGQSFAVLSPQLSRKYGSWEHYYIDEMLRYAKNLPIDTNRIYLTGLSLGGGGVLSYASLSLENARKFAALVPVAAVCYYDYQRLAVIAQSGVPVWAFTGSDDRAVNPQCTLQAIDGINAKQPTIPAKKSVYKGIGHNSWDRAYDTGHKYQQPNVYEWMLRYTKKN